MNKTDLLFQMMEHPQAYTDQQWQEILSDEECRELYTLMSKTQSAYDGQQEIDEDTIDAEWKRLTPSSDRRWLRVAAMFISVLMISGIAIAAIHFLYFTPSPTPKIEENKYAITPDIVQKDTIALPIEEQTEAPVVFDNVPLDSILPEIAKHYGYNVSFRSDKSRPLRLFLTWNPQDSIQKVADKLNLFEQIHITLDEKTLIVE